MIYFVLPSPRVMLDYQFKNNTTEYTIVNLSPASWQICRGLHLNFYSQGCPGWPEKYAGLEVKRVSWLGYFKHQIRRAWCALRQPQPRGL